jgi:hypothetical protein
MPNKAFALGNDVIVKFIAEFCHAHIGERKHISVNMLVIKCFSAYVVDFIAEVVDKSLVVLSDRPANSQ